MFNIGPPELIVILLVALLIVGPKRLPEVGKSVGRALREIRRQTDEVRSSFEMNLDDDADDHDQDEAEPVRDVTSSAPMAAADSADADWDATGWDAGTDADEPTGASNPADGAVAAPAASEPADSGPVEPAGSDEQAPDPEVTPDPVPVPVEAGRRRRRGAKDATDGSDGSTGDAP